MPQGTPKPREGKGLNAWRSRQEKGAIMKPSTFQSIEASAEKKYGSKAKGEAVAGAAYWKTAKEKYGKHHSPPINPKFDNPDKY